MASEQDARTVPFTNVPSLFEAINEEGYEGRDSLTFTNVSPDDFTDIESERLKRRRKFRFRRYDSESQILTIAITTALHESLHAELYGLFLHQPVFRSGTERSWASKGATWYSVQGPFGRKGKEGDSVGGPRPERGRGGWPTLVIVPGVSEGLAQLREDMIWWFTLSNHDVKIVLLAKCEHSRLIMERWEEAPALEPVLRQTITITKSVADPAACRVTGGALVLPFKLLFLRDPGPGEGDVVISVQQLQQYAIAVYE